MPTPSRPRRTQAERREATRAALLDATIECLVDYGYAGVTTTRIVDRAGVSRGAQVHHFPTKAELVTEALDHLARRRAAEILRRGARLPEGRARLDAVLDMLWAAHAGSLFAAALELWVAARTDPELRAHLVDVERAVAETILGMADELFGEYAARPGFNEDLATALAAMRGLALLGQISRDRRAIKQRWEAARERLRAMFERP